MLVHQALCGELKKGWDLLDTTLTDMPVAKNICHRSDLQDSPPSGLAWLPVVRGFLINNFYLIIKTYPDNSPNVRNGRVFSHCLILNKLDLPAISNLTDVFASFRDEMDKTIPLEIIQLAQNSSSEMIVKEEIQLRFNKIIQIIARSNNQFETFIWVGEADFEIAVRKFWQILTPLQKEIFHFGINFNPNEVPKKRLNLIVIPDVLERKFENNGFNIVRKNETIILQELAEKYIAGDQSVIFRINSFTEALETKITSREDILLLTKCLSTFENLNETTDVKLLNTLSNIIAKFAPDATKARYLKHNLVNRISTLIEFAAESEILLLRNFPINSFEDSEHIFSVSFKKWCLDFLFSQAENETKNFVPFISQICDFNASNWLINLFQDQLTYFLSQINLTSAQIIWKWVSTDISILKGISDKIENSLSAETFFCELFNDNDPVASLKMKHFAEGRKWFKLHATILKTVYDFEKAIKEQLKIDLNAEYFEGIEILTKSVSQKKIIEASVVTGDIRIIFISGNLCKVNPYLLEDMVLESLNWQRIWLQAIRSGNKVIDGLSEPDQVIYRLFDLLIENKQVDEELLNRIGETNYSNVLNYQGRNQLWQKLPSSARSKFLKNTAKNLLEALSKTSLNQIPADNELSEYIINNGISDFLYFNKDNIKATLPIFDAYPQLPEHYIENYISNYTDWVDHIDAIRLGRIVNDRNYRTVCYVIFRKHFDYKQFSIALSECYQLLDFFSKGLIKLTGAITNIEISEDDWWDAFIQLSYFLYQNGPSQNKVWTQSEGNEYDLLTFGTGKEIWIAALQNLRNNKCSGDVTVKKLLKTMYEEHKNNENLKIIKDLWKKIKAH